MSPHYDSPFSGHMHERDPRSPLFAAGGCIWPTVPGYHLLVVSTNAWGALSWLNVAGIQLKPHPTSFTPDEAWWIQNGGTAPITWALLKKLRLPGTRGYTLQLTFQPLGLAMVQTERTFNVQHCNVTHPLNEFTVENVPVGGSGDGVKIVQCAFDETRPPGGWPP